MLSCDDQRYMLMQLQLKGDTNKANSAEWTYYGCDSDVDVDSFGTFVHNKP